MQAKPSDLCQLLRHHIGEQNAITIARIAERLSITRREA